MIAIGFGGNVGGDRAILDRFVRAREAFAQIGPVRSARVYRTAAIGPMQEPFLNTAITVRWDDAQPDEVISTVLEIERLGGRDRRGEARWGPRTIDLDVLLWDDRVIRTADLDVPHPRLAERRFALVPLIELLGAAHPLAGSTLGELEQRVSAQSLVDVAATW